MIKHFPTFNHHYIEFLYLFTENIFINMKRVTLILFVTAILMSCNNTEQNSSTAQNIRDTTNNRRQPRIENRFTPEGQIDILAEQLNLTDAEKDQVKALLEKNQEERAAYAKEQNELRESRRKELEAQRAEMQALREKTNLAYEAELEKIIGKERLDQWKLSREENRAANRAARRPMRMGR